MARKKARFTPAARRDLDQIWDYTAKTWSIEQAEVYLRGLFGAVELISDQPEIARERTEFSPPIRLYRYQSHLIIFKLDTADVDVIRIVHGRQDWQSLLRE